MSPRSAQSDSVAPFKFAVCGIEELGGYCTAGVTHVLSILDPVFPDPAAFADFGEHRRLALRFHDVIGERAGMIAPSTDDVKRMLDFGSEMTAAADTEPYLLVHCHAGISRSTASIYLLLAQARPDLPAEEALAAVRGIRPAAWPNMLLVEFGDELLGRDGELVAALRSHYRDALRRDPAFGALMLASGRTREVLHGS